MLRKNTIYSVVDIIRQRNYASGTKNGLGGRPMNELGMFVLFKEITELFTPWLTIAVIGLLASEVRKLRKRR